MIDICVCPSTLAEGYTTYSPVALKALFDGKAVSHYVDVPNPSEDSVEAKEAIRNVGRVSYQSTRGGVIINIAMRVMKNVRN